MKLELSKTASFLTVGLALSLFCPPVTAAEPGADGWQTLFDGKTLTGWHVSTATSHSRVSKNTSGGKWEVVDGAITGTQDTPGNGGIIITDELFGDFEVVIEMRNDFGPDSGLFLRSTEDGKAYQAMIDYHSDGNLMGIYGEGLGGKPHLRNYSFKKDVTTIIPTLVGGAKTPLPVLPESWANFWRAEQWNELRARIVGGDKPTITTWINGVKFMEWTETEARHPAQGGIALQVHGGGNPAEYTGKYVRYRSIRVKKLDAPIAK